MASKGSHSAIEGRNRISRRLILYILLFSSLITLILTALQLARDYRHDVSLIHQRLQQIELTNLESIRRSAWTMDTQALRLQLQGLLKLPDIVALELTWADGRRPLQVGDMPQRADIEKTYQLSYPHRGQEIVLGQLRVIASLDQVYQRLLDTTLVILASQAVKTFLVALFILMVFERLVTRHLASIARFTRRDDLLHTDHILRLDRRRNRWNRDDELEQVASSINQMATSTRQAFRELHEERARQERLANVDALTGLPNRHRFMQVLRERLQNASPDEPFSVLLGDLNGFKEVNDSLGHQAGDMLLRGLQARLEKEMQDGDLAARLGGDEFAFLINGDRNRASQMADRLQRVIRQPFEVLDVQLSVGVSIGIAHCPMHANEASDLLRFADVAMYMAKNNKEPWRFYIPEEHVHGLRRLQLMSDLRRAIEQDQLQLHYQPQIEIESGRCVGAEALLRWRHPAFGWIQPAEFIPFAEKSDLMTPLSHWVVEQAIRDHQQLQDTAPGPDISFSLNISSRNLQDLSFAPHMMALFQKYQADCSRFILEITESAIMRDPKLARGTIQALSEIGLGIAIDDFGTGYSSLAYLKHLPVNEIKIDRTFVMDMLEDGSDAVIVKSTIDLSHNLGLRVIAEGVENPAIIDELARLDCDLAQGYHYAKPLPLDEFIDWLDRWPQTPS